MAINLPGSHDITRLILRHIQSVIRRFGIWLNFSSFRSVVKKPGLPPRKTSLGSLLIRMSPPNSVFLEFGQSCGFYLLSQKLMKDIAEAIWFHADKSTYLQFGSIARYKPCCGWFQQVLSG